MKVLIVYPKFYVYGGGETLVVRLCNYLSDQGIDNAVLTTSMTDDVQNDLKRTRVIVSTDERGGTIGEMRALCGGVRKYGAEFDVLNPHNYPAELTPFFTKRPSVWMCNEPELHLSLKHGSFSWRYKTFLKALVPFERYIVRNRIAHSIVSDNFNAKRFECIYGKAPTIVRYGIDTDFFSKGDRHQARLSLGVDDKFVVLHVGMMTPLKNQMASLETLKSLKGMIGGLYLVLAGSWEDEYKRCLDAYIAENDLHNMVRFTGHVNRADIRDWYHAADVLLHPIKSQGGWLSPFEALCAGTPIIVSPEMTAADMVGANNLGTVTDNYAKAIQDIYRHRESHIETARNASGWVKSNLSWDSFGAGMLGVYRRSMEGSGA